MQGVSIDWSVADSQETKDEERSLTTVYRPLYSLCYEISWCIIYDPCGLQSSEYFSVMWVQGIRAIASLSSQNPKGQSQRLYGKTAYLKKLSSQGPLTASQWLLSQWLGKPHTSAFFTPSPLAFEWYPLLLWREHRNPQKGMWISSLSVIMGFLTSIPCCGLPSTLLKPLPPQLPILPLHFLRNKTFMIIISLT